MEDKVVKRYVDFGFIDPENPEIEDLGNGVSIDRIFISPTYHSFGYYVNGLDVWKEDAFLHLKLTKRENILKKIKNVIY